jgi:hypothetical protein
VPSEENWTKASETVTFSANKYNIRSSITIKSLPRSGAIIKYQTVGQRRRNEVPMTAKQLSTCVESVSIGLYHIWSERNGKQTSDINHIYEIVQSEETIEIIEDAVSKHK